MPDGSQNPYGQRANPNRQCYTLLKRKKQTSSRRIAGLQNGCKRGVIPREANADRGNPYFGSALDGSAEGRIAASLTLLAMTVM